jgi:hypothetical protein
MIGSGRWFIIKSGEYKGRLHLAGWDLTAIRANPTSPRYYDGCFGLATCPRCGALVSNNEKSGSISGDMWGHEQWHAATDYPIPADLETPSD